MSNLATANLNTTGVSNRGWWPWLQIQSVQRPLETIPASEKGEEYHDLTSRYYEGSCNVDYQNWYRACYATNLAFATDRMWGTSMDVKSFLMDKGRPTSKVALRYPIVRPMLTRLIGAMDNVSINADIETYSPFAVSRKRAALLKMLMYGDMAKAGPTMTAAMQGAYGVGPNDDKTISDHENTYRDPVMVIVDEIMHGIARKNGFEEMKKPAAERLALSGMCAMHCVKDGQDLYWELQDPMEVYWDTSAIRPDMTDGIFNGLCPLMSVSSIASRWPVARDKIAMLDKWASQNMISFAGSTGQNAWPQMRPRVFTTYWRDMNYVETGYVLKDGAPHLCVLNQPDPDRRDGKPMYTDEDLMVNQGLPVPENRFTVEWTEEEWKAGKIVRAQEEIRYCTKIPWEYMPGAYTGGTDYNNRKVNAKAKAKFGDNTITGDLVLAYGKCPLQESIPQSTYRKGTPLKISTWSYLGGFVVSPLTAAIWPQRVANMVTTDLVWRLNKAGNKSVAIDTDAMKGSTLTEQQITFNLKEGDSINLKGSLMGGVQNAVREIDTGPNAQFYQMWGILGQLGSIAEQATGIFKDNYGAPSDPKTLVRVKEIQTQQAGIMQQPFYSGVTNMFLQAHQFDAMAGKDFYARQPWLLSAMCAIPEEVADAMASELLAEEVRATVRISADAQTERQQVDTVTIPNFQQLGWLDAKTATSLLGHSRMEDVYEAAADFTAMAAQAAQAQAQEAQKMQQAAQLQAQKQQTDMREDDLYKDHLNASLQSAGLAQKAQEPLEKERAKAIYAPLQTEAQPATA